MRGCAPLGCGCGLFGLLIQLALIAVVVLFTGSMLGVLPEEITAPGDTLRKIAFDAFGQEVPPALCKTYPFLADIFGNCR